LFEIREELKKSGLALYNRKVLASNSNLSKINNQSSNEFIAVDTDLTAKGSQENIAVRNNALKIASTLQTTIRTQNTGILGGLYLKESAVIDGGRSVRVVMRWDKKHNDARKQIRNLMAQ
jgi:multidrug efflux pump subunit AcrB